MKWGMPRLRLAGLALPLLTAGCMSGVMPGVDAADPSCVLLCALTRDIVGEPAPQPVAVAAAPGTKVATARPIRKPKAHLRPLHVVPVAAVSPAKPRKIVSHARLRSVRHPAPTEVSVVPQAPSRTDPPTAVALAPAPPVAAAPSPAEPARSLSQAIPGSAGIVVPVWQAQ